ncbi:divergent polysaccharide deacetylase family protein [bacterium]|nr:divergent polysaccharide deacetylase family protein [bacterium]
MNRLKLIKIIMHRIKISKLIALSDKLNIPVVYKKKLFCLPVLFLSIINLFGCASDRINFIKESENAHNLVYADILSAGLNDKFQTSLSYHQPLPPNNNYSKLTADYKIPPYMDFKNIMEKIGGSLPDEFFVEIYQAQQAPPLNKSIIAISKDDAVIAKLTVSQTLKGFMAIVIDDVGNNTKALKTALMIKRHITYAVLPKLKLTKKTADILHNEGYVLILHQPMASIKGIYPGPGSIEKDTPDEQIIALLKDNLSELPWAVGINNHMGSAITADEHKMEIILNYLKSNNLIFLDSVTGQSVCSDAASKINYPIYKRDVFIDNKADKNYINKQIDQLVRITEKYGQAVGIGHFKPLTMQCIYDRISDFDCKGIKLVYINELLRKK